MIKVKKEYEGAMIACNNSRYTLYNSMPQSQLAYLLKILGPKYFTVKQVETKNDTDNI